MNIINIMNSKIQKDIAFIFKAKMYRTINEKTIYLFRLKINEKLFLPREAKSILHNIRRQVEKIG